MCGISGFQGSFEEELLRVMSRSISHRGPDDSGFYFDIQEGIGLAHRRLSIIELSSLGHQPMWDTSGQVAIIFNGEIYNFRELRIELQGDGYSFRGNSDTEVLLNLYLKLGQSLLSKLNGIFAFAIWDSRSKTLFVARDGFGVKPFYYSETPRGFLFSSELKAILKYSGLDKELDHKAILLNLIYLWTPAPHTMLSKVKKLEPGCAMEIRSGSVVRRWRYYDLPYDNEIENVSEKTAIDGVKYHVEQAVQRQMVADVPVGAFLSGGLDSSAVVALAKKVAPTNEINCFTMEFEGDGLGKEGFAADLPYARKVAEHLGVNLHTVRVGPSMVDNLEDMIYFLDEPHADLSPLNAYFISRLARENGIKVLLSGAGGDDIFTGYRRHYALMQERLWDWIPGMLRGKISRAAAWLPTSSPTLRRIGKAFQYAGLNGDERTISYFYWAPPKLIFDLLSDEIKHSLESFAPSEPMIAALSGLPPDTHALNKMLYLEGRFFLADFNLNFTDKMGMANGVDVRVPLLDRDLVDFVSKLPVSYKQRGTIGKWVFKKAMEPYLPRDVIYRPKTGFGAPLRYWLQNHLRPLVDDILSESAILRRGLFNPVVVRQLVNDDRSGRRDGSYVLFSIMSIELWLRKFVDG